MHLKQSFKSIASASNYGGNAKPCTPYKVFFEAAFYTAYGLGLQKFYKTGFYYSASNFFSFCLRFVSMTPALTSTDNRRLCKVGGVK